MPCPKWCPYPHPSPRVVVSNRAEAYPDPQAARIALLEGLLRRALSDLSAFREPDSRSLEAEIREALK